MKTFFEKYFGIGGSASFMESEKHRAVIYEMNQQDNLSMVAEEAADYKVDSQKDEDIKKYCNTERISYEIHCIL